MSPPPPPPDENESSRKMLWCLFAFLPSFLFLLLAAVLKGKAPTLNLGPLLLVNLVFSSIGGFKLAKGSKHSDTRVLLSFGLAVVFFVLNIVVVVLIGCCSRPIV